MSIEQIELIVACVVIALTVALAVVPALRLGSMGKHRADSSPKGWVLLPMSNGDIDADEIDEENIILVNSDI